MYTRKDYLGGKISHREYYAQFVNEAVKQRVLDTFGLKTLKVSYMRDEHFNDNLTPLKEWDLLAGFIWAKVGGREEAIKQPRYSSDIEPINYSLLKEANEGVSNGGLVCIYKEAARQIVETL